MKQEVAFSVVVFDNYQYLHQAASRFMGEGGNAVKFNCFWNYLATVGDGFHK